MVRGMNPRRLLAVAIAATVAISASAQAPQAPSGTAKPDAAGVPPAVTGAAAASESAATGLPEDPALLLGLNPAQALSRFGPPARVYAVRGAEPWQDDVVFEYGEGFSLFLFMDRVWQVRVSSAYAAPVWGITVGATLERASAVLGSPDRDLGGAYEWALPGEAWPVRLRGVMDAKGRIAELYAYRADF